MVSQPYCNLFTPFIDYSKAFDRVKHKSLVDVLLPLDAEDADTRLLTSLFWNQTVTVQCNTELSDWMCMKQEVRQGCVASPHIFTQI